MAAFGNGIFDVPLLRRPRRPRVFQERQSPLETLTDADLYKRYRFRAETIRTICGVLRPHLQHRTKRSQAISVETQVLLTLRYLASGSFQEVVGDTLGIEKSTVSRVIQRVTEALVHLMPRYIRYPSGDDAAATKAAFHRMAGFPAVIGCIDGTHIRIQAPREHEAVYVNRKNYHSINVQAVCDHQGKFTNICAKWPGSSHDSHIFNNSMLKDHLDSQPPRLQNGVLLGDSGYGCKPYLLTPYLNPRDQHQQRYNEAHKRTRVTVERAFGWWKRRFHILHSEVRLRPDRVCRIIGACAVLHNIAIDCHEVMEDEAPDQAAEINVEYVGRNEGRSVRDHIALTYF